MLQFQKHLYLHLDTVFLYDLYYNDGFTKFCFLFFFIGEFFIDKKTVFVVFIPLEVVKMGMKHCKSFYISPPFCLITRRHVFIILFIRCSSVGNSTRMALC